MTFRQDDVEPRDEWLTGECWLTLVAAGIANARYAGLDHGDAESLAYEAIHEWYRRHPPGTPIEAPPAYVRKAAFRMAHKERDTQSRPALSLEGVSEPRADDWVERVLTRAEVQQLIAQAGLSSREYEVMKLSYFEDLKDIEVAKRLEIRRITVTTYKRRILDKLRSVIERRAQEFDEYQ